MLDYFFCCRRHRRSLVGDTLGNHNNNDVGFAVHSFLDIYRKNSNSCRAWNSLLVSISKNDNHSDLLVCCFVDEDVEK